LTCKQQAVIENIVKNMVPPLEHDDDPATGEWYRFDHADMFASDKMADVLAFSILGRVCANDRSNSGDGGDYLQFSTVTRTLGVRRRGCEYEKVMYSSLLSVCIIALSFLITLGVLSRPANAAPGANATQAANTMERSVLPDAHTDFGDAAPVLRTGVKYRPLVPVERWHGTGI
jgi:hypothetical protein